MTTRQTNTNEIIPYMTMTAFLGSLQGGAKVCALAPNTLQDITSRASTATDKNIIEIMKFHCITQLPKKHKVPEIQLAYTVQDGHSFYQDLGFREAIAESTVHQKKGWKDTAHFVKSNVVQKANKALNSVVKVFSKNNHDSDLSEIARLFFDQKQKICFILNEIPLPEINGKMPSEAITLCVRKPATNFFNKFLSSEQTLSSYTHIKPCSNTQEVQNLLKAMSVNQGQICSMTMPGDTHHSEGDL